ncbi:hypothetical protein [Actinomyces ruminicola]|nr:hypothetical protein [Actinomyces ruminicola]
MLILSVECSRGSALVPPWRFDGGTAAVGGEQLRVGRLADRIELAH